MKAAAVAETSTTTMNTKVVFWWICQLNFSRCRIQSTCCIPCEMLDAAAPYLNDNITESIGLPSISQSVSRRCNSLFSHVARLQEVVPAHKALNCHVNLSPGWPPSGQKTVIQVAPQQMGWSDSAGQWPPTHRPLEASRPWWSSQGDATDWLSADDNDDN